MTFKAETKLYCFRIKTENPNRPEFDKKAKIYLNFKNAANNLNIRDYKRRDADSKLRFERNNDSVINAARSTHNVRKSFDASSIILKASNNHTRMPTIAQGKSNYINYSHLKKTDASMLLYGNDTKYEHNSYFGAGQIRNHNPRINIQNMLKREYIHQGKENDASLIVMHGQRLNNTKCKLVLIKLLSKFTY